MSYQYIDFPVTGSSFGNVRENIFYLESFKGEIVKIISSERKESVQSRLPKVNVPGLDVDECWKILKDIIVDIMQNVSGKANMQKSIKGDA